MFSATVPVKSTASCATKAMRWLHQVTVDVAQVDVARSQRPVRRLKEAQQQLGEGRLAGAGRADHSDDVAVLDPEAHARQCGRPAA